MVEVRNTRMAAEVLADEGTRAGITRVEAQVAFENDDTVEVRVTRLCAEVLGGEPGTASVTRVDVQAAFENDDTVEVRASRLAAEVLASQALEASVTRVDVQAAFENDDTVEVRVSRIAAEILAREGVSSTVTPLPLVDDAWFFLHNWASRGEITTSFLNDVTYSPDSGAESRRGLGGKPSRSVQLEWLVCDDDIDLERFEVILRRMTEGRFQIPLYPDQAELAAAYGSGDTTLVLDTTQGRWFQGQRIVVVQLDAANQVDSISWHLIDSLTGSDINLTAALGVDVPAGSLVFPVMDCEAVLEPEVEFLTARVARFSLEAVEAPGASQLPPVKADTPSGFETFDGRPIWVEQPDWTTSVVRGRRRHGAIETFGRAPFVDLQSDRARVFHNYTITGKRDDMWPAVEFFETRRGRLRAFWHVDEDQTFAPAAIDASGTFVSVSVLGDLTDFDVEWDHVGIVMADGTVYVRQVDNIQEILTVFRITMNTPVDTGLDINNVVRVARARVTRFEDDALTESWEHTNYGEVGVSFIEALDETDYES